ncbi:hypothetical protein ABPG74_012690 [Tetrahymena malaccensis]
MEKGLSDNWMPLESNPDVINDYIQKIGVNTEKFSFQDLYDSDEQYLKEMSKNTLAALLIFPLDENASQEQKKEIQQIKEKGQIINEKVYYMKQYAENACGTIAIMHAAMNLIEQVPDMIRENSILHNFFKQTEKMTPEERADYFMNDQELKEEHVEAVQQGETEVDPEDEDVLHHFVCLVPKEGHLYELDGCKPFPINHGETTPQTLLPDIYKVFQKFLSKSENQYSFSILLLQKYDN